MTTPFWCVFIAFACLWLARIPAFVAVQRGGGELDSREPERQLAALEGFGGRAVAAHEGLRTKFAPFAAAVVVAHLAGGDPRRAAVLSIAFVVSEVVYVVAYLANADYLRIFVWLISFLVTIGLFVLAIAA
jgi:uncharacterized MAPEG superfamily protein